MHITLSSPQGLRFIDLCIFLYENCLEVELCGSVHTSFSKITDLRFQICQLLALDSVFFCIFISPMPLVSIDFTILTTDPISKEKLLFV